MVTKREKEYVIITIFPGENAAATIYISATTMQYLFKGGAYSRVTFNSIVGTDMLCGY